MNTNRSLNAGLARASMGYSLLEALPGTASTIGEGRTQIAGKSQRRALEFTPLNFLDVDGKAELAWDAS